MSKKLLGLFTVALVLAMVYWSHADTVIPRPGAPINAPYITKTPVAGLTAERALSTLATGCLGSTTGTGEVSARSLTSTANQITVTNGDCSSNPTFTLSSTLVIPGPGIEFSETSGDSTCSVGTYWIKANSTTGSFRKCQNGTVTDLDTGGGGSIIGTVGTLDEAIVVANGTSGGTAKGSTCTINNGAISCPNGFRSTGGALGLWAPLEGAAPGPGDSAGQHNVYINTATNRLASHEHGGSEKDYVAAADSQVLTNKIIRRSYIRELAGCDNGTSGAVYNRPATNGASAACDVGTNKYSAYMAFNDTTDQGIQGSFILPVGYSGGIDWKIRYKMASATSGTVGGCVRLVRVPTGAAADPAFPAQAAGNCVSQTVPGTVGFESEIMITNVTCASCVAGDRVLWLLERDANGSAVSDSAGGDMRMVMAGPIYASVE